MYCNIPEIDIHIDMVCIYGWSHGYTDSITGKAKSLLLFHGIYGHTAQPYLHCSMHARARDLKPSEPKELFID